MTVKQFFRDLRDIVLGFLIFIGVLAVVLCLFLYIKRLAELGWLP